MDCKIGSSASAVDGGLMTPRMGEATDGTMQPRR